MHTLNKLSVQGVNMVEIAYDEQLLFTYGTRIPVLHRLDTNVELSWPFNADDVAIFLA